jgi:hypothetical protein
MVWYGIVCYWEEKDQEVNRTKGKKGEEKGIKERQTDDRDEKGGGVHKEVKGTMI